VQSHRDTAAAAETKNKKETVMMFMKRNAKVLLAGFAILTAIALPVRHASAEDYPARPIRIVVPYPPGGFNDTLARTVGDRLSRDWKQTVITDNRPGGNTLIGNTIVAKSPPDGYTLLITPLPFSSLPALYQDRLPYNSTADFKPVIWAASTQNVLVVRSDAGINSVSDLLARARATPFKVNYGSTGSGSSNHLSMELFERMTDTKMTHVPYKGSAPAVLAMLSGEIDVLFDNLPNVITQIKAGKLKAIGVTGLKHAPLLPDVPTVAEAGVPGYEVNVWFGIQAPAGTPDEIVGKLNAAISRILKSPEIVNLYNQQGVEVVASTPERFTQLIASEIAKWGTVVRDAKVVIQ
jgi:tripartite-type tricarboxylate transporter receptor subunit TctC